MLKSSGGEAEGEAVAPPKRNGGRGKGMRKVTTFTDNDKENIDIYGGNVRLNETKSPLPLGFPRLPLQDITAVLRPLNNNSDEDEPNTGMRKPFTRLQGLRKTGNVQTTVLSERTSKNAGRAGPSKTRKKQVTKIALSDAIKTVIQTGSTVQMKEQTTNLTVNLSSSVQLTEQTSEGQKIEHVQSTVQLTEQIWEGQKIEQVQFAAEVAPVKIGEDTIASDSAGSIATVKKESETKPMEFAKNTATEQEERGTKPLELTKETGTEQEECGTKPMEVTKETAKEQERGTKPMETGPEQEEQKAAPEKPQESSIPSYSGTKNDYSQDPKRRKPLSTRSKVSSFR